jgi:hypothetical protein
MTHKLAITIALYIERFHTWPVELRLSASSLYDVVLGMGRETFEALARRVKIRVAKPADIAVDGAEAQREQGSCRA